MNTDKIREQDRRLLDLFWAREERAVSETMDCYGARLHRLAGQIVSVQDAEECVSDTMLGAWNRIPPELPEYFFAWLAKVCRNFALNRLEYNRAGKRSAAFVELSDEMAQCIPDPKGLQETETAEIGHAISDFLSAQTRLKRVMFMRRYWFGDSIHQVAERMGCSEGKVKTTLHRMRGELRDYLEKEGIAL